METKESLTQILHRIPWFNELSPAAIEKLANIALLKILPAGEVLFHEGDTENCLYILLDGEVFLETYAPGYGPVHIFTAEPLDVIGWSGLTPVIRQHTDTARALVDSTLVCFHGELIRQLCDEDHELGYVILRRIANITASRVLVTRLHLFEVVRTQAEQLHVREQAANMD